MDAVAESASQYSSTEIRALIITSKMMDTHSMKRELVRHGCIVMVVQDKISAFSCIHQYAPNLVILDQPIPMLSTVEFCQYVRSRSRVSRIMVVADHHPRFNAIESLNSGADDCILKPFHPDLLGAKIRAHLRRIEWQSPLRYESLILDPLTRKVTRDGHLIHLTPLEFDLLEYFMQHPNQVKPYTQILEQVWGYDFEGTSNVLEVYIYTLRQKLERHNPIRLIQNIRSVGYVLRL